MKTTLARYATFGFGDGAVPLAEYAIAVGALAATVAELHTEDWLGLDDNVSIPLSAALALAWGFRRVRLSCAEF